MRLSDLEKVTHWSEELAKLRAALAVMKDGPTKVEMRFSTGDGLPDGAPIALIDIHDMEFSQIAALVRQRLQTDIAEVSAALKELGAEPDQEWRPGRHA
jgi:hypothetical protein